uniref:Type I cytokine receptor cytokine-binding domain-containing protein n=1 Tax=Mola mola TaxID=94237 RepID=A0A3Q3WUE0_MOLML
MASKSWLIFMLIIINWRESTHGNAFTVDPPEKIIIFDPGHLGHLNITWSLPASLMNMKECAKLYQLEYFNTYKDTWTAVRTTRRTFSAQFDLMKDIRVRVYTLLSGPCTNGIMIKSTNYTELVQKPPSMGVVNTAVQDFVCVYHNMKYMVCNWGKHAKMPANSQLNLYFWHRELEHAKECSKYIISSGIRSGCNFTGMSLPDFTDINLCLNGSSPKGPLKPKYISLQIQNHVKPESTETLHLQASPDAQLKLTWDLPVGRIPRHCLEWQVEHNKEGPGGKIALKLISTGQMSLNLPYVQDKDRNCFRVRSKLHKYCADKGFWSEWSRLACYPEKQKVLHEEEWDMITVSVSVAFAIIAILVLLLFLCVAMLPV